MQILHITFDYADSNVGNSTIVVKDLIDVTKKFARVKIISLRRITNPAKEIREQKQTNIINYDLFGLPYGIFIKSNMQRVYRKLTSNKIASQFDLKSIDLIHSHKMTFEGFVGYEIARKFNKRLIISLRQTDFYVLKYRRDLVSYCLDILKKATIIFYIAPYMRESLIYFFGKDFYDTELEPKLVFLPNCLDVDKFKFNPFKKEDANFLSIFWMQKKAVKRKNVEGLFQAFSLLNEYKFIMDVIGSGEYIATIKNWSKNLHISDRINFLGFINNDQVSDYLGQAKAFLLPSFSETLGMVYVESLLCGTPILYSKGTGFDGFFENVGIAVNPYSIEDIAKGIEKLYFDLDFFVDNISKLYQSKAFDIFRKGNIQQVYKNALVNFL